MCSCSSKCLILTNMKIFFKYFMNWAMLTLWLIIITWPSLQKPDPLKRLLVHIKFKKFYWLSIVLYMDPQALFSLYIPANKNLGSFDTRAPPHLFKWSMSPLRLELSLLPLSLAQKNMNNLIGRLGVHIFIILERRILKINNFFCQASDRNVVG